MKLSRLIRRIDGARLTGSGDTDITGIALDSRDVRPGNVFVAVPGTKADGHAFVPDAISRGASAVVVEAEGESTVPTVTVDSSARALAAIASAFYGDPATHLTLCGVTGTNGKTSVAHMIQSIMGESTMGIVGTLGHGAGELTSTVHTTPDAVTLHRLFREMVDAGCSGVVMEVSSHAVRQHRTWGLDFEVGILTNVTHDHLDFHHTIEDYRAAKREFCDSLVAPDRKKPDGTLVHSADDTVARQIGEAFAGRAVSVGYSGDADVRVCDDESTLRGTKFRVVLFGSDELEISTRLLGTFVASNAALAAAAARVLGAAPETIRAGLESIDTIPGRFEALGGNGKPLVILDYSHTQDAFERVLATCRQLGPGRLTVVFGCGGDRDREKRPLIGRVAQRLCDRCIVTTDNPRTEAVGDIVDDILSGMPRSDNVVVELDRAAAIASAVATSGERDIVALLGKGHERYQQVGGDRLPFSDYDEALKALEKWEA
jgi:UDP-N-acetylmuramoyl-L-alanyl-D-glutamate--2,6-diaminopimelate ligase